MNTRSKIYLLIFVNHVLSLIGFIYYFQLQLLWLSVLGLLLFGKLGGEAGFHRYLAHRSYSLTPFLEFIVVFCGCLNCFGSPVSWVVIHRAHHMYSDTTRDPHGSMSSWRVWFTKWRQPLISRKLIRDLSGSNTIRFFHRYYFHIVIVVWLSLFLIAGASIPIYLISVPAVITFHSAGLVNTVCHRFGYRRFNTKDTSYNNFWVNLFTMGSGLHNNHHRQPNCWNNSCVWWELDIVAPVIWLIQKREE